MSCLLNMIHICIVLRKKPMGKKAKQNGIVRKKDEDTAPTEYGDSHRTVTT